MRKHGWQLPYHPLQVVAIAVFLALGFAFYVFFLPFVGGRVFQYVVMGLYTPLVTGVFCLYIWCAATDPGDPGVFKSKKYLHNKDKQKHAKPNESRHGNSINEMHAPTRGDKSPDEDSNPDFNKGKFSNRHERDNSPCCGKSLQVLLCGWCPFSCLCGWLSSHKQPSEQQASDDGMFYCSLCEVEVLKYSKHCRVCDKCVDSFDHHCRWINNCIGRKNYRGFFTLMVSALLLLILQWSVGILVLVLCFLERKQFSVEITSKLGSSFSLVPFVVVLASCTFIAMVATLPLAQLFFFHVLLIKKGISTYDYIVALREQDQQGVGQQSPQMSSVSSFTGLSSTSSFNAFHRGAWCTPPRLFLEDQFDVVPPEISVVGNPAGKRIFSEESTRKRNAGTVKISPWALARLNAEEVSKAAAEARKKSKILQPVVNRDKPLGQETDSSFGNGRGRMMLRPDNRRRANKRVRLPLNLPLEPLAKISASATDSNNGSDLTPESSSSLAPLQLEARSAFRPSRSISSTVIVASSPESSLDSPDLHPFRVFSSGAEESQGLRSLPSAGASAQKGIPLSRSTSDGYDASGGEDSDRVSSRIVHRSSNWANLLFNSTRGEMADELKASSLVGHQSKT